MAGVRIEIDPALVPRVKEGASKAQKWLDEQVLSDCTPYVPMDTGTLYGSGIKGTQLGSGKVEYNAPYARDLYYATSRSFSKDKHPLAQAKWFEAAKAVNKDKWKDGVKKLFRE